MLLTPLFIALVIGYLLGSLPFGYLVARARGVNIFEVGSRNPGATNVRRVCGAGPGNLVFALDALKGAVSALWPLVVNVAPLTQGREIGGQMAVIGLVGALLGHSFSCFTKFRGGKGVATSAGGLVVLLPWATLIAAAVWVISFYATRYVSLASILAAVALAVATFFLGAATLLLILALLIAGFVILRHRSNIVRLLNGTENKFVKKGAAPKS